MSLREEDNVVVLPLIRSMNARPSAPAPFPNIVVTQLALPAVIHERLEAAAERMGCGLERAAEALIIFSLAQAEKKTLCEFTQSLAAQADNVVPLR